MPTNIWKSFEYPNYAIRHPIRALRTFFRVFKWAFQRTVRGYADIDMWGMSDFLSEVIPNMLDQMANEAHGYPCMLGNEDDESAVRIRNISEWQAYLREMARHFRNTSESQVIQFNEFEEEYFNSCVYDSHTKSNGAVSTRVTCSDEIFKKYCEREKEIFEWQEKERDIAFDMLKPVWFTLWD